MFLVREGRGGGGGGDPSRVICLHTHTFSPPTLSLSPPPPFSLSSILAEEGTSWNSVNFSKRLNKQTGPRGAISDELRDLIDQLIVLDPTKRLSGIEAVKAHKAFAGYDWVALEAKTIDPPFIPNCSQVSVTEEFKLIDS